MASAPPMEIQGPTGQAAPCPPTYEESMNAGTPFPPGAHMPPPPVYSKAPQPPYPAQGYTQMYSPPPPPTGPGAPVVTVQTVYVQPGMVFGYTPVQVHCPNCAQTVVTRLEYSSGTMTWLTCAGLFIFGCIYGCCLIPFCVDSLKDVTHHCPNCSSVVGVFKRL